MTATGKTQPVGVEERGPSLKTKVAGVTVVLALAGLAAYTMFSGPTSAPVPGNGAAKPAPSEATPPAEERFPEGPEGGDGG